jgi:hypothetical protein
VLHGASNWAGQPVVSRVKIQLSNGINKVKVDQAMAAQWTIVGSSAANRIVFGGQAGAITKNFNSVIDMGKDDMVHERAMAFEDYQDQILEGIGESSHATFQGVWELFGDFTRNVATGAYAFKFVHDKEVWRKTIKLGMKIINTLPQPGDSHRRDALIADIKYHIEYCAGNYDCHVAFLMALILVHTPWLAPLLLAKGLATIAKICADYANQFVDRLASNPHLSWAVPVIEVCSKCITALHNAIDGAIRFLESCIGKAAKITSFVAKHIAEPVKGAIKAVYNWGKDLVVTTWKQTVETAKSIWDFISGAMGWKTITA